MSNKIDIDILNKYNLMHVCNWNHMKNVAIEYHSNNSIFIITYLNIRKIQRGLKKILTSIKLPSSQFIGISSDIPIFCIPSLILGIISSGHAFVYLTKESQQLLLNDKNLNIQYIFLPKNSCKFTKKCIIKRIIMHKQSLILIKVLKNNSRNLKNIDNKNCFAYAVTTSGSTGYPSIVRVTHASIIPNIIDLKRIFKLTNFDKIVQLTPITFDPSIIEIFLSISSGATLLTVSDEIKNNPYELLRILNENHVTFISSTPSLLLHRWTISNLNTMLLGENSKLRILLLGGEPFPNSQTILKIKHINNHTRIFNIYGITEVSCWASINEIYFDDNNMIIKPDNLGTILSDTIFQVRNPNDNNIIINDGEGLLYIGSNTRICAINNEKLCNFTLPVFRNSGDFVIINCNGEIKFNGRQDSCIKRFGTKIYLKKLECHVKEFTFVEDSHVIFIQHSSTLHIFFTIINNNKKLLKDEKNEIINKIWEHVRKLPTIMHPDFIHYLEQFKITKHGKICKDTLKKLCKIQVDHSDIGQFFEYTWKNYLPVINDKSSRFVDTGGTSIIALEIFGKLTTTTNNEFPELIGMLLENKTLYECQQYVINQHESVNLLKNKLIHHNECNNTQIISTPYPMSTNTMNMYYWQKCRGKTINFYSSISLNKSSSQNDNSINQYDISNNSLETIELLHLHNLKKCVDASPTVFQYISNDEIYVTVGSHSGIICTVQIFNNQTWKVKLPSRIEASILVINNFKGIVGCHDGFIYCIHLMTGEIQWKFQTHNIVKCLAVMCSEKKNIFIGSYDHSINCISIESGLLVWRQYAASTCATPLIHDTTESVIIASLDGNCISLNQITGKYHWKYRLPSPIFSSPILINNNKNIIISDVNGNITSLNVYTGDKIWNIKISEYIFADITKISKNNQLDNFIIATKNGNIYKYEFENNDYKYPKLSYQINCNSPIFATPWVNDIFIIIANENGEIKILNLNNGNTISIFKLADKCFSSPVLYQDFIFIGCRDNNLYILKRKNKNI